MICEPWNHDEFLQKLVPRNAQFKNLDQLSDCITVIDDVSVQGEFDLETWKCFQQKIKLTLIDSRLTAKSIIILMPDSKIWDKRRHKHWTRSLFKSFCQYRRITDKASRGRQRVLHPLMVSLIKSFQRTLWWFSVLLPACTANKCVAFVFGAVVASDAVVPGQEACCAILAPLFPYDCTKMQSGRGPKRLG